MLPPSSPMVSSYSQLILFTTRSRYPHGERNKFIFVAEKYLESLGTQKRQNTLRFTSHSMLVKTAVRPFRTSLIHKLLSSVTSVSTFSEANANLLAENGIWARALEPIAPIKSYGLKSNAPHQGTVFITSQSAVAISIPN